MNKKTDNALYQRIQKLTIQNPYQALRSLDRASSRGAALIEEFQCQLGENGIFELLQLYPQIQFTADIESVGFICGSLKYKVVYSPQSNGLSGLSRSSDSKSWALSSATTFEQLLNDVTEHLAQMVADIKIKE